MPNKRLKVMLKTTKSMIERNIIKNMIELILGFFVIIPLIVFSGVHSVTEGHIGVYFRGGAILDGYQEPGWNIMLPFITTVENVQVTVQTDKVNNVPCGTSGGVNVMFEQIEVVNRLKKHLAQETVKNYTVNYDKTWIFDKIQ